MNLWALSLGASVLFALVGMADAVTVEKYSILQSLDKLTNSQLREIGYAADGGGTFGGADLFLPGGKEVVWDSSSFVNFTKAVVKNPSVEYQAYKSFKSEHSKTFGGTFAFPENELKPDGACSYLPGVAKSGLVINGSDPPDIVRVTFQSTKESRDYAGNFYYYAENKYNYTVNGENVPRKDIIGPGWTNRNTGANTEGLAWSKLCFDPLALKFTGYLNMQIVSNQYRTDSALALRTAVKASLQGYFSSSNSEIVGITVNGYTSAELLEECTPVTCPGLNPANPLPGSGGTTPTPAAPPCTLDNGNVSGNPYDCAPTDNENNCSIINVPCNLRWLFIPREDFFTQQLPEIFTKSFNMPVQVTDRIMVDVTIMGQVIPVGFNFNGLVMNDTFRGIIQLICGFSCLYWLLNFFGIPNLFGGSAKGNAEVKTAIQRSRRTK